MKANSGQWIDRQGRRPSLRLVVKITGMAFWWIGSTTALGAVVRKPYTRWEANRRRGLRPFILNLCSVAFLTSPRDVVAQADTKGVIYERASYCFCRRVGF